MKLIGNFVRENPWQSAMLVTVLVLAGIADGLGLSALLPLLDIAFQGSDALGADNQVSRFVTDSLGRIGVSPSLGAFLLIFVVGIGIKNLLIFVAEQRIGYLAADVATELRLNVLAAVTRATWRHFVGQSTGRLANAMATEALRASNAYVFAIRLLVLLIEMMVYGALALLVSWQATLLCLAASVVILLISHSFVRLARKGGKGQTKWYSSLLRTLTDLLGSLKTLKAMGREQQAESLLKQQTHALRRELKREVLGNAALIGAQEPLYMIVLAVGIYVAISELSMELATVTFLVVILARLLKQGGRVQREYQRMIASESAYWSLQGVVDAARAEIEPMGGSEPPELVHGIRLVDVSVAYGDDLVLNHASLEVPAGRMTCLVGESGAGKSTIADLIIGLTRPQTGRVLVDDRPLEELDLRAWREGIGYVPQDNLLLHDTVMRNVALAQTDITEAQVEQALRFAGAFEFVSAMPEGVHTLVGEAGARLSGGQRQRILIARALVHEPRLLILDEATSALDSATEQALCRMLESLKGRMTILAITHQRALREIADRVYLIERGQVASAEGVEDAAPARAS